MLYRKELSISLLMNASAMLGNMSYPSCGTGTGDQREMDGSLKNPSQKSTTIEKVFRGG